MKEPNWKMYIPQAFVTSFLGCSYVWSDISWIPLSPEYLEISRPIVFGLVVILPLLRYYSLINRWFKSQRFNTLFVRDSDEALIYGIGAIFGMLLAAYVFDVDLLEPQ